jgi:predicted RNase H-like nuclease
MKEFSYKYKNYSIGYDMDYTKSNSALCIVKLLDEKMYVIGELKNESADVIVNIIDDLQQERDKYKQAWDELRLQKVKEIIELLKEYKE